MGKSDPAAALHVPEGKITMPGESATEKISSVLSIIAKLSTYWHAKGLQCEFLNKQLSAQTPLTNKRHAHNQSAFSPSLKKKMKN